MATRLKALAVPTTFQLIMLGVLGGLTVWLGLVDSVNLAYIWAGTATLSFVTVVYAQLPEDIDFWLTFGAAALGPLGLAVVCDDTIKVIWRFVKFAVLGPLRRLTNHYLDQYYLLSRWLQNMILIDFLVIGMVLVAASFMAPLQYSGLGWWAIAVVWGGWVSVYLAGVIYDRQREPIDSVGVVLLVAAPVIAVFIPPLVLLEASQE